MRKRFSCILAFILIIAMLLTGCSSGNAKASSDTAGSTGSTSTATDNSSTSGNDTAANSSTDGSSGNSGTVETVSSTSTVVVNKEFTANDLEVGYEDSTATHITLSGSSIKVDGKGASADNNILTIKNKGTYVISGTLSDGQIVVDAGDKDKVRLVLDGATINCTNSAPIYVKNADKVFITLNEGTENTLSDGSTHTQTDDNNVDSVIFSKADLTINGNGTLNITANYKHGIVSKDDLTFTGGTYNIKAVKNTINGKNSVKISDGTFNLDSSNGKGITSKNADDTTTGYVYIKAGTITITDCTEGVEGTAIVVDGGTIDITAQDDGFNAASASNASGNTNGVTGSTDGSSTDTASLSTDTLAADTASTETLTESNLVSDIAATLLSSTSSSDASNADASATDATSSATVTDGNGKDHAGPGGFGGDGSGNGFGGGGAFENDTNCYLSINGGSITVNALGDGLDSNGSIYISGGEIYVSGPTEANNGGLDYNGTANITGGTIIVTGSTGMAQSFSDTSTQYSILNNFTSTIAAGTKVTLTDKDGNVVASFTPDKLYQSVVISTPQLTKDETYTLTCGDQTAELTLSSVVTSNGQQGGFGGFGGMGGRGQGKMPDQGFQPGQGGAAPGAATAPDTAATPDSGN